MLMEIAKQEMEKGKKEDEMLDQTLKTIEIANINDLDTEKNRLILVNNQLRQRKEELERQEDDLLKEKAKIPVKRSTILMTKELK